LLAVGSLLLGPLALALVTCVNCGPSKGISDSLAFSGSLPSGLSSKGSTAIELPAKGEGPRWSMPANEEAKLSPLKFLVAVSFSNDTGALDGFPGGIDLGLSRRCASLANASGFDACFSSSMLPML